MYLLLQLCEYRGTSRKAFDAEVVGVMADLLAGCG